MGRHPPETIPAPRIEELNARAGQEHDARRAVEELIAGLFAPGTLHAWVESRLGLAVAHALPGPAATHVEVVAALVGVLVRRGLVDDQLFSALAERDGASAAVAAVAAVWRAPRPGSARGVDSAT